MWGSENMAALEKVPPVAGLVFQCRVTTEVNFQSWHKDYLEMVQKNTEAGGYVVDVSGRRNSIGILKLIPFP